MDTASHRESESTNIREIAPGDFCAAVKVWQGREIDELLRTSLVSKDNVVLEKDLPNLGIDESHKHRPLVVIDQEHGKVKQVICNDRISPPKSR